MQILGTDGQVLGGGTPVLPGMKFELKQLEKQSLQLQHRLKELRAAVAQPKPTKPRETPALLPETVKPKQLSVDDLLGGDIKRRLDQARAKLASTCPRGWPFACCIKLIVGF